MSVPCNPIIQNLFPYMPCGATTAADTKIAQAVSDPTGAILQTLLGPMLNALPGLFIRAGLFAVALVLVIAGLFILVSQQ